MNTLFLDAIHCKNIPRPPVWIMRQAGRHMASYRAMRQRHSFLEMCHTPDLIVEATLLPITAYGMDAAILFSDILLVAEAMGVGLRFEESVGPIIDRPIQSRADIDALPEPDMQKLSFVKEGIAKLKKVLKVPLIGFCGAPYTVASYMIEGRSSRDLKKTKQWMQKDSEGFHALLNKISRWSAAYLQLQVSAGADALQLFDSWANTLSHNAFLEFSLPYMEQLLEGVRGAVPTILYCRGSSVFAPLMAEAKPAAIGLDWNCHLPAMRKIIPSSIALQGNFDPDLLWAPLPKIEGEVKRLLFEMEGERGWIVNLGHGLAPDVPEEAVRTFVNCVKEVAPCVATSPS